MVGARKTHWLLHWAAKPLLLIVLMLPLVRLVWGAANDGLGPNPAEALIRGTGDWTLRLLWLTLAVTPLRELLKQPALARFRRMLGVTTFCYACLHLLCYAWLDMGLDPADIAKDIAKRPFILMGFTAWLLLLPLAATSFNRAIKALGAKRWQALHKSVYAISLIALAHFIWMRAGKQLFGEPALYGALLAVLLAARLLLRHRRRGRD
ncbi:protein-methionine-sulfoxide reductase heme-binding subunit MsrQ [Pelomonas sp. SE-A7]|uniref:sulfite oxidase heme-binding subunit YedZ n=1 Tax=Pelomonas sp. SE-A7 TaxID=3054953 RepID=UPI00259D2B9E|nr:protein-methionine-sulfoxide reductase heme-binding subunit MsrQ [Pelomonas sp. SE-A7]MDM4767847.1 protein-methionine-sulfoxide reductase heme-binding subunit MsrQ [Pelomonas sp. SE-A7]